MLTIRLQRKGKKNQPFFKIIVTEEKRSSTGGRFVEELGFYNPLTKERSLKGDRAKYWMSVGAKPSDTVYNMLVTESIIEGKKRPQHKKSKKKQLIEPERPEAEAAPQPKADQPPAEAPVAETPPPIALNEPKKETTEGIDPSPLQGR
ncbi:MAG: 30S ribosomal protein S16 [bacterium]|nr:30S ribosomal protein S16 [bacterium]